MKSELSSVKFIKIPDEAVFSNRALKLDKKYSLPVQNKDSDAPGTFDMKALTEEQILSGILVVLCEWKRRPQVLQKKALAEHALLDKGAIEYYCDLLKKVRPNVVSEISRASVLKSRNKDFDLAETLFLALLVIEKDNPAIELNYALMLDEKGTALRNGGNTLDADKADDEAFEHYKVAMRDDNTPPETFFNAGFFYLKRHDAKGALDAFETYIALTSDTPDEKLGAEGVYKKERAQGLVNLIKADNLTDEDYKAAYELIEHGEVEKGLAHINKYLRLAPKSANGWFLLGWGLRKNEQWTAAKDSFLTALKCIAESGEGDEYGATKVNIFNELAICLMETGEVGEAKKYLECALSLDNENVKVISNLGFVALKEGKKADARKYFQTALEYSPKDKIALTQLAILEEGF